MKKKYQAPRMKVVDIKQRSMLLAGSVRTFQLSETPTEQQI